MKILFLCQLMIASRAQRQPMRVQPKITMVSVACLAIFIPPTAHIEDHREDPLHPAAEVILLIPHGVKL